MLSLRKKGKKQSGFTLMELLIVIAILGLLLGLIAPRLGGITSGTADNVCDTNNKGIRGMTALFLEQNGALPGGLTNMVEYTAADAADIVSVEDSDEANDGSGVNDVTEVISAAFASRNFPGLYQLNANEVLALQAMGVGNVFHNTGWDTTGTPAARPMLRGALANESYVMMVGVEGDATGVALVDISDATSYGNAAVLGTTMAAAGANVGNPDWAGRIVMAVNDQCELITSGLITASALCPTAVLAADEFSHDEFFIILPRLETTATAMAAMATPLETEWVDAADTAEGQIINVEFTAQEAWQFEVACPEGHKWPAADAENWVARP